MDNGTQFNNMKVESFCEMYEIMVNYYQCIIPRLVESKLRATSKMIVSSIQGNLEDKKEDGSRNCQRFYGLNKPPEKGQLMNPHLL